MRKSETDSIQFEFVSASLSDVNEISLIEKESFSSGWTDKLILDEISNNNSLSFVCKVEGHVKGYIFLRHIFDEGEVLRICVSPDMRKKKIASSLMEKALNSAFEKGVCKVFLEVRKSNVSAISLYEKFGFSVYSERKNYYPDNGEDALLMQKIFNIDEESE